MGQPYDYLSDDEFVDLLLKRRSASVPAPQSQTAHGGISATLARRKTVAHDAVVSSATPSNFADDLRGAECGREQYQPLDSVWFGEDDAELIEQLLRFYPHGEPRLILDATVNGGRFWRGSSRPVIGLDINAKHQPDVCADNAAIPFRSGAFDVVVYDPPHIPNQGRDKSKDFNTRFGLGARSSKENGYSFSHTFPAFMSEASPEARWITFM